MLWLWEVLHQVTAFSVSSLAFILYYNCYNCHLFILYRLLNNHNVAIMSFNDDTVLYFFDCGCCIKPISIFHAIFCIFRAKRWFLFSPFRFPGNFSHEYYCLLPLYFVGVSPPLATIRLFLLNAFINRFKFEKLINNLFCYSCLV